MAERLNSSNLGKNALNSSGVQAFDPVGAQLGASPTVMRQSSEYMDIDDIREALDLAGEIYDERGFLGGVPSSRTAPRQAELFEAIFNQNNNINKNARLVQELSPDLWTHGTYLDENGKEVAFSLPENEFGTGQTADYYLKRKRYISEERTQGKRKGWTFKGVAVAPSSLSDYPTSTTNWRRPRTVAAGYDYNPETDKGVITVVFRDGVFYNYYDVPPSVWVEFHDSFSKGPMLNRKSKNGKQAIDGKLLSYKHGPADMSSLSPTAQEFLYKVARAVQIYNREAKARINAATGEVYNYRGAATRGAPQTSRVKRKRNLNMAAKKGGYNPHRNAGKPKTP
jgi:hypothetical protein